MTLHIEPRFANSPDITPVSQEELDDLRDVCSRIMAKGGETGEIAAEILRISNELTNILDEAKLALSRFPV